MLLVQQQSHPVAGYAQGVEIAALAQAWYRLGEGLLCLVKTARAR